MGKPNLHGKHEPDRRSEVHKLRRLLIVDDDARMCRVVARRLVSSFDVLRTATTLDEANHWLATEMFTHIICDQNLGDDVPKGATLVATWRRRHHSIERAVLFTGDPLKKAVKPPGLDAIVQKTADFFELMTALGL